MRIGAGILVLGAILLTPLTTPAPASESGVAVPRATELTGDWMVNSSAERRYNETIVLSGNLTISGGGLVELYNSTLLINCTFNDQFRVRVTGGSALVLRGGSLLSARYQDSNTSISISQGSSLWVNDSALARCGFPGPGEEGWTPGVKLDGSRAEFNRARLEDNYAVLYGTQSQVFFNGTQIRGFRYGLMLIDSHAWLLNSSVEGVGGGFEFNLLGSTVSLLNSTYSPNLVEFKDDGSELNLSWPVGIRTVFWDGTPAEGANVTVLDSQGREALRASSDASGWVRAALSEYKTTRSGRRFFSPYNFSAEWRGLSRAFLGPLDVDRAMEVFLVIDTSPPSVIFTFPSNGFVNSTIVDFWGSARDNDAVAVVELSRDGGASWVAATDRGGPSPWQLWNCTLELGPGSWEVVARVRDRAGLENRTGISVEVDLEPPFLELESPVEGLITNASLLRVEGRSEPGAMVFVGDDPVPVPLKDNGRFSASLVLKEGENLVVVRARDSAGNEASCRVIVFLDTIPPPLNAWPSASLTNFSSVVVFGETEPGALVTVADLPVELSELGTFSVRVNLTPGWNRIPVSSVDRAGNVNIAPVEVVLDQIPPRLNILSPVEGAILTDPVVNVSGTADDESGIATVELGLDDKNFTLASGNTSWRGKVRVEEGNHTISVRVYDRAGNVWRERRQVSYIPVTVDTSPPVVSLKSPLSERVSRRTIKVTGLASDPSGVSSVELSIDGVTWSRCRISPSGDDWWGEVSLEPGTNQLHVRATDGAGNTGTRVFTIKYEPYTAPRQPNQGLLALAAGLALLLIALGAYVHRSWRRWMEKPELGLGELEVPVTMPERGLK
ncbi:MAG: Ig-like domain-containing protein [Thermoplasmata archaeon]